MATSGIAGIVGCAVLLVGPMALTAGAAPQNAPARPAGTTTERVTSQGPETREAIDVDFAHELSKLERTRLERLARLAASQDKEAANATYQEYFRSVIASGLYKEAEPVAERVIGASQASPQVLVMAEVVNMIAEADRGAYEESLKDLNDAVHTADQGAPKEGGRARIPLPLASRAALVEAYYQKLVQGDQFAIARKAMATIAEKARDESIKDLASRRLRQLDLIGTPAPPIVGTDLDGKPVRLADEKGNVVLVVFWATWHTPSGEEVDRLERVYAANRDRGFRIIGINLDAHQEGAGSPEAVAPAVRRFLLDHNVRWPNLISGKGDRDYAKAYHISEIPANVLIGRDGTVIHLDLTRANLDKIVAKAVAR